MSKNHISIKEEKVGVPEDIQTCEKIINNSNDNINKEDNRIIYNSNIISSNKKKIYSYRSNSSNKNLKNEDLCNDQINTHFNKLLNHQALNNNINNNNVFKSIKITNKMNKTENKKENKNLKVVTVNKDDLYNSFLLFQQLISKYDNENENNVEYIKNKLFEFISVKKVNFFSETIEFNDNYDENENANIFDVQNYMPIYCKSQKELNININIKNNEKNNKNNNNLIKSYSFSFGLNDKNRILNNYSYVFLNEQKDTIKSNSQIFNEYLLIDKKFKDKTKTISQENSKSFHHNYSFDLKNREKNEFSFHSIPDKDKEKEKDKYYVIDNYDYMNKYNYDNFNSYEKKIDHKSPFDNKGFRLFPNNLRKYSTEEDLLIEPLNKKNKSLKKLDYENKSEEIKDNKYIFNKNSSIKEKVFISPTKPDTNKFENIIKENSKNKLDSQSQQQNITLHEIKVNKNKSLSNKEQIINEKIKELDEEIKKFKEETNKVTLLKEEYEKLKEKLHKDIKRFNLKKQIPQKNYKGQSEVKLIMSITQHNQALILNNNKKKETIRLLKERIFELENIIKAKNNNEHANQKNIFKKINNYEKNYINSEHINIFTKKRNNKKKNNESSYILKRARINLKKKLESNSSEKIKGNNQTMNNNTNNINKIYLENKNVLKRSNNKKLMNVSYNQQNIKNNILNSKLPNYNNNYYKKYCFNACSNKNFTKKNHLSNQANIAGNSNRNNSINSAVLNNVNKLKLENPVIHTNLYIYEKLINKEREKEKNYKKINININAERDIGYNRRAIKELKTEIQEKNKNEKDKKSNNIKNYQKSHGKNLKINRLDIKTDIFKNKSNINILNAYKIKGKNNSINKKNVTSIRPLIRNTTNFTKNEKTRENIKNHLKEVNNSLDNKAIKKDINVNNFKKEIDFDEENDINGYDFVIPDIYKKNNDAELINSVEQDNKKINIYDNHKKEIIFKSGVRKEIFMDGHQLVYFPNGDKKQKFVGKEEKVIYYYNETNTVQTTYKNGLNIFKFSNGQIEKHYPDGSKFIIYTNGIKRKISKSGREEIFMPNDQNQGLTKEYNNINSNTNKENENNNYIKENETNIFYKKSKDISSRKDNEEESNLLLSFLDIEKNLI